MAMPKLKIGEIEIPLCVVQGGMGVSVSWIELIVAVMNEGGLGVLSTVECGKDDSRWNKLKTKAAANEDALRNAIGEVRRRAPGGFLGVNVMVAQSDYETAVRVAADEGVDVIFCGSALPLTLPELVGDNHDVKLVPIVSSAKGARAICRRWSRNYNRVPDAFVVEGPLAGGHLGFKSGEIDDPEYALEKLIPATVTAVEPFEEQYGVSIPIIAAGGIYTGADIYKFLQLGAAAAQLGTRFVTTIECDAAEEFKQAYIRVREEGVVIIESPLGLMGRAIDNDFLQQVKEGKKKPTSCRKKCLRPCDWKTAPYCIVEALVNAVDGNLDEGYAFCGSNAHRATEIVSVHELMEALVREYEEAETNRLIEILARTLHVRSQYLKLVF